jgi:hypothetical protein
MSSQTESNTYSLNLSYKTNQRTSAPFHPGHQLFLGSNPTFAVLFNSIQYFILVPSWNTFLDFIL